MTRHHRRMPLGLVALLLAAAVVVLCAVTWARGYSNFDWDGPGHVPHPQVTRSP